MKFIDEAIITVQSGDGGRGCVSFRREKHVPRGGPDGGDGGKGGDVVLVSTYRKRTLYQFRFKHRFKAPNGRHGQGKQRTGKDGENIVIEIPPGTVVSDADDGAILKDFTQPDESFIAAEGGRGGLGNRRFKTATRRAPRFAQPGETGRMRTLKLELKLLADVGIIGLPNAGKSTLIGRLSAAKPKIGSYPFTTLAPNLGVVRPQFAEPFVIADIPGLIEGAHQGAGLGTRFLKHIERTRILVHLIDAAQIDPDRPLAGYEVINRELASHDPRLAQKAQLVVLNKIDLDAGAAGARRFEDAADPIRPVRISAHTGEGIDTFLSSLVNLLDRDRETGP